MPKHEASLTLTSSLVAMAWNFIYHHVYRLCSLLFSPRVRERFWWPCFW